MGTATATILSSGAAIDPAWDVLSIDVAHEVGRIPWAELRLVDGDVARRQFAVSSAPAFAIGREIEIQLRYEGGDDATVFKGRVVRHAVEAAADGSRLKVVLEDAALQLTAPRRSAVVRDQSDDEIVRDLLAAAKLEAGTLTACEPRHPEIVRYQASDWDFILTRAEANGLLVTVEGGVVSLRPPEIAAQGDHRIEWGIDEVLDFEMEADGGRQRGGVDSAAWGLQEQQLTEPRPAADFALAQGDLDPAAVAEALGLGDEALRHAVPLDPGELAAWADGALARRRLALVRGRIGLPGRAGFELLQTVEIAGVGGRFNGRALLTGVRHRLAAGGWRTDLQLGLGGERFCRRYPVADCPAAGLLPPACALQIGVVADFEDDPDQEYRLRVALPAAGGNDGDGVVWARLASPDAGAERGYFFRPEPGDEVVVGFLADDPRHPVVLGALYGSAHPPPAEVAGIDADNAAKAIVTRAGTTVAFLDGDKAALRIETPQQQKILLDDDGETIEICDQHGNSVVLSADGIALTSAADLKIEAAGKVEIKGQEVDVL